MELEQWKELIEVLECGSLTAASEKMGYTLSTISRRMSYLEQEAGFPLLCRGKKGVTPTKECEQLLPYIKELVYASERVKQMAASIRGGEEGEIRIGTAYRHYYRWLTEVTSEYHRIHPGVHFRIYNGISTEFARQIEKKELDFALISKREGAHEWHPIGKDRLVALLPVKHELAKSRKISLEAFLSYPYIATCPGLDIDSTRFFEEQGVKPDVQFSTMDLQATYAMVEAGMGISITNRINSIMNYKGICHRDIEPTQQIEIGLACQMELSPVAEGFFHFIENRLTEL